MTKKLNQLKQHDEYIPYENSQKLAINKAYFHQIVFTVFLYRVFT